MYKMLSYPIALDNPTIPGNPETKFKRVVSMDEGALYNTTYVSICTHNDSHVDAPGHFNKDGITVDQIPPEDYIYDNVVVVDVESRKGLAIDKEMLSEIKGDTEMLLIHTGHSKHWKTAGYTEVDLQPWLTVDGAQFLLNLPNLRAVGIDFMCIDKIEHIEKGSAPVHQMFCGINESGKTILIYENLYLKPVIGDRVVTVFAFPLRLAGIDGSPVTMLARV